LSGLGWWAALLGGLALHLTVAEKYWPLWLRARAIDQEKIATMAWLASVLQALIAAGAAYGLGWSIRAFMVQ